MRPSTEELQRLYIEEKQSLAEIAEPLGVSAALVRKWLLAAGIKTRNKAEARRIAKKAEYSEAALARMRLRAANARANITPEGLKEAGLKRRGLEPPNKGKPMSEEQRQKLIAQRADPEYRRHMSEINSGERSPNWKGGIKPEEARRLDRAEWRRTRALVYERDNWTCQDCGQKCLNTRDSKNQPKLKIQCHHVIPRRLGGLDVLSNLTTLCMSCHHRRERLRGDQLIV